MQAVGEAGKKRCECGFGLVGARKCRKKRRHDSNVWVVRVPVVRGARLVRVRRRIREIELAGRDWDVCGVMDLSCCVES